MNGCNNWSNNDFKRFLIRIHVDSCKCDGMRIVFSLWNFYRTMDYSMSKLTNVHRVCDSYEKKYLRYTDYIHRDFFHLFHT